MVTLQNDMVALLFQLSLFRTFQKILNDESTKASAFKEMKTFALFVIRQFFAAAEKVKASFPIHCVLNDWVIPFLFLPC